MDFGFPVELDEFRQELRQFVRTELPSDWVGAEEDEVETSQGIRKKLANRGWLTMAWPAE